MHIIPYMPEHLSRLVLQPKQEIAREIMNKPGYAQILDVPGLSYSAMSDEGEIIGIGGVLPLWESRAEAWALLTGGLRNHFLPIHRATQRFLDSLEMRRVETAVDCCFTEAIRWAEMLGFEQEGIMYGYTPDGRDCYRYARVRRV